MSFTHSSHYTSTEQLPTHVSICTYRYTSRLELLPYGTFFSPLIVHIQSQSPVLQPNSVRLHPHSASNCFNYTASQLSHCRKQQATQTHRYNLWYSYSIAIKSQNFFGRINQCLIFVYSLVVWVTGQRRCAQLDIIKSLLHLIINQKSIAPDHEL